jgi:glycosyltransferase involved in cell wall biosynthesis
MNRIPTTEPKRRSPRLLVVTSGIPPTNMGGTEMMSTKLAEELMGAGWDVRVIAIVPNVEWSVASYTSPGQNMPVFRFGYQNAPGMAHVCFQFGFGVKHWIGDLERMLAGWQPDCIHVHYSSLLHALVGLLLARRVTARLIYTWHSQPILEWQDPALTKVVSLQADGITTVSSQLSGELVRRFDIPAERIQVIHNAVAEVDGLTCKPSSSQRIIGVGRFTGSKRWVDLLHAFCQISSAFPEATLEIIGDGPERNNCLKLAKTLRIQGRVQFPGVLPHSEVIQRISSCAVVVLPSEAEGLPLALIEGAACGRPLIGARGHGAEEVIEHGLNGYLFPPREFKELAAHLQSLLSSREKRDRMGEKSLELYNCRFRWANILPKYQDLLVKQGTELASNREASIRGNAGDPLVALTALLSETNPHASLQIIAGIRSYDMLLAIRNGSLKDSTQTSLCCSGMPETLSLEDLCNFAAHIVWTRYWNTDELDTLLSSIIAEREGLGSRGQTALGTILACAGDAAGRLGNCSTAAELLGRAIRRKPTFRYAVSLTRHRMRAVRQKVLQQHTITCL